MSATGKKIKMSDSSALTRVAFGLVVFVGFVTMDAVGVHYDAVTCSEPIGVVFEVLLALDCLGAIVNLAAVVAYVYSTRGTTDGEFHKYYAWKKIVSVPLALARLAIIIWLMVDTFRTSTTSCDTLEWNVALSYIVCALAVMFLDAIFWLFGYLQGRGATFKFDIFGDVTN